MTKLRLGLVKISKWVRTIFIKMDQAEVDHMGQVAYRTKSGCMFCVKRRPNFHWRTPSQDILLPFWIHVENEEGVDKRSEFVK